MNPGEWIALGAIGVSVAGLIFKAGEHSSRLTQVEKRQTDTEAKQAQHGEKLSAIVRLEAQLLAMDGLVREISHDLKNLMTGRTVPARRRSNSED